MKIVKFFKNGNNAPDYSCDHSGNNSGEYIKVEDVVELITAKIKYIESNEMYPAYGLNSQVKALEQLKSYFVA